MIIPNIWKNKKCSKPPTRYDTWSGTRDTHQKYGSTTALVLPWYYRSPKATWISSKLRSPQKCCVSLLQITRIFLQVINDMFNRFWGLNLPHSILPILPFRPTELGRVLFWYCTVGAGFVRLRLSIRFTSVRDPLVHFEVAMGAYFMTFHDHGPALWSSTAMEMSELRAQLSISLGFFSAFSIDRT